MSTDHIDNVKNELERMVENNPYDAHEVAYGCKHSNGIYSEEKEGMTAIKAIVATLRAKATKGDIRAAELLLAYAYGKPKQTTDANVTLTDNTIKVIYEDNTPEKEAQEPRSDIGFIKKV